MAGAEGESKRCFLCLEIPPEIQVQIAALQRQLVPSSNAGDDQGGRARPRSPVRLVKPEAIHITLRFLGDQDVDAVQRAGLAAEKAARGIVPHTVAVDGIGAFPNARRPRVIWARLVEGVTPTQAVYRRLEEELSAADFDREENEYSPHVTLARVDIRAGDPPRELQEALRGAGPSPEPAVSFTVSGLTLMQSRLGPSGPTYTPLRRVAFTPR